MKKKKNSIQKVWLQSILGVALVFCLATGPAISAESISPDADRILKSMSVCLAEAKTLSMNADIDFEIVSQNGQKLQISSLATVVIERPSKFHITRKGMLADAEFVFDGKILTMFGKNINAYAQTEISGSINDAILAYESETGIPAPGADFLFSDPYSILSSGIESGIYVGTAYVNGIECHHLAFREAAVDWQLWVRTGDTPLPMKYVITTKWHTGAPQYEIRFRDWNQKPLIKETEFSFSAPAGAVNLHTMQVTDMGELLSIEEEK